KGVWRKHSSPLLLLRLPISLSDLTLQKERDNKRVQRKSLDESETKNHRQLDLIGRIRVAADAFHRRCSHTALPEGSAERANPDGQSCRERDHGLGGRIRCTSGLGRQGKAR